MAAFITRAEAARVVAFNGAPLDAAGWQTLRELETYIGEVPNGCYWYDTRSGGAGVWGGPAAAYLGPGLALGGPMPAQASGGGSGRVTGVFINGRELHVIDVQGLSQVLPVQRGRYWWDAAGNVGFEGGPVRFNFYWVLQQQRGGAGASTYRQGARPGESTYVGQGCTTVHGRLRTGDEGSSYSYYAGC
jgi:hypothetical protein